MSVAEVFQRWVARLRGGGEVAPPQAPAQTPAQTPRPHLSFPPQPDPPAVTKAAVDAYLAALSAQITALDPAPIRSALISGTVRCGKTIVARHVCARLGMVHIPCDRIRNATYSATEGAERARLVKYIYKKLLLMHPTGLVIEGTVFLDRGVTLPLWAHARGIKVFAVGYALDDAARKARSMIAYRRDNPCWTKAERSDADIRRMARKIVSRSRDIRAYCEDHGLTYLDLDSGRFNTELRRVSRVIRRKMRAAKVAGSAGLPVSSL